ncbi:hypothetical protein EDB86DRAFT_2913524 [Lactarius hatsudake]|nr:hypothetical protein EDB86DRAFT_2913524 [Lactarius hatsudake]
MYVLARVRMFSSGSRLLRLDRVRGYMLWLILLVVYVYLALTCISFRPPFFYHSPFPIFLSYHGILAYCCLRYVQHCYGCAIELWYSTVQ